MKRPIIALRLNCVPLGFVIGGLASVLLDTGLATSFAIGLGVTLVIGGLRVRAGAYPDLTDPVDAYTTEEAPITSSVAGCLGCTDIIIIIPAEIIGLILTVSGLAVRPADDAPAAGVPSELLVVGLIVLAAALLFAALEPVLFKHRPGSSPLGSPPQDHPADKGQGAGQGAQADQADGGGSSQDTDGNTTP